MMNEINFVRSFNKFDRDRKRWGPAALNLNFEYEMFNQCYECAPPVHSVPDAEVYISR